MDTYILTKKVETETMVSIWFPPDWRDILKERAEKQGLPIYKYLMYISEIYEKSMREMPK